ncbi:MAG: choice-of-anchor J domain-containing protein [Bacteroidales bacterium]|nr:choice-of-anchor J domain-containing protein [Bacteroidales bacterium]
MRKFTLALIAIFCVLGVFAQSSFERSFTQPEDGVYDIEFNLNYWDLKQTTIDGETYQYVDIDVSTVSDKEGWAELPFISASVKLPKQKNVNYEIVYSDYTDYDLDYPMLPSRGTIYRNQDPSQIPYEIDPESIVDEFYPSNILKVEDPFIFRDVRGTAVRVTPFQYNAVTGKLRVYNSIKVRLTENNEIPTNPLLSDHVNQIREVEGIYENMFINYNSAEKASASLTMEEYGDILIITTSAYEATMAPYILWKKQKGYNVNTQVVATGTNVETTIQTAYNNNPNLMFVQLVGDWADIKSPTITSYSIQCPTDPHTGCVSGTDDYIDISVGRFSCTNTTELTTQINKAIDYEKTPDMTSGWRETFIGVASDEGGAPYYNGDDSEIDYEHVQRIFNNRLDPFTYNTHQQNYAPSASAATLHSHINAGASTIAYCGHGSETTFVTTGYSNTNINSLTNGNKLPFIVSVACVNGAFHTQTSCFAETWLRKSGGGAVVTWMSTINQPWQPPQRGQDYFYDILIGGFNYDTDGISQTTGYNTSEQRTHWGSIVVNASVLMLTESSGSDDIETIKTWTTFGDASLQLRTEQPNSLTLSNTDPEVGIPFEGIAYIDGTPAENVLICISADDNYYSGLTNGSGAYSITHSLTAGEALLVATAFNSTTVYETTTVIDADPCAPVSNLVGITSVSDVILTWEVPAEGNVTGYNIYKGGSLVTTVTGLTYTHTGQANGTYEYCVKPIFDGVECYDDVCVTVVVNDGSNSSCDSPTNLVINEDNPTTHTLSWVEPAGSNNIFDDIEGHTAFTINSAGDVPWTFIDGDGSTTYSIADYTFTNQGLAMATIVFDPTLVTNTGGDPLTETTNGDPFFAHSGDQFFATFNASTGTPVMQTNDWIISPELGFADPFTFSFYARSGHKTAYAESFRVAYSTTTNTEAAFTNILQTVNSAPFAWTEYSYTVPANAKYVAINCNSTDMYYFCVDDIYIGDGTMPGAALTGYNVYCDGIFLATTTETSFTNTEADEDYHEYCIEAVYVDNCISPQICETIGAAAITYDIVASAGANGTITPNGTTAVNEGSNQTYNIAANSCYEIADVLVDGSSVGAVSTYTFNNVTATHTISASFNQISYSVATTAGTGGNITAAASVDCGDNLTFTVNAASCYEIETVTVNGTPVTLSGNSYTINNVTENIAINASFDLITYSVSANAGTGGNITAASSVNCGDDLTFTVNAESCYEVGTVTVNGTPVTLSGNSYTVSNVTENITVNASFDAIVYNVTESAGANGSISVASTVNCGNDLVISFDPDDCYEVTSCTINGTPVTVIGNSYTVVNVSENIDIIANFGIAANYDIIANAGTGGSINLSTPTVACGGEVTLTATPDACYEIGVVTVNGTPVTLVGGIYTITNITEEITIAASFNQIMYDVTANAGTGGNIVGAGTEIGCGETLTFTVEPDACYQVESILLNGSPLTITGSVYTLNNVSGNVSIEASFSLLTYTISANSGTGGSISPQGNIDVDCGANQSFTITPDANYVILDVQVNGLSVGAVSNYEFTNISDDESIIAIFQQSTDIAESLNSNISVYPNPADAMITIVLNRSETNASIANIVSVDGKIVKSIDINSDRTEIDIRDLASGVYFVSISSPNENLQMIKLIRM